MKRLATVRSAIAAITATATRLMVRRPAPRRQSVAPAKTSPRPTGDALLPPAPRGGVLDGTRPLHAVGLADLALERAVLGGRWLAGVVRPDDSFCYLYYPTRDDYVTDRYNEVRHAGTTYSLFQVYGATADPVILAAAEAGARYVEVASPPAADGGRVFAYEGRSKLGGQALALVALLEQRRVTLDTDYDSLIAELAAFLLAMELPEEPGRYYQSFAVDTAERRLSPDSDYYPGEALLALTRLARHFPDGPYLTAATRAADYLVHRRDGDIPALGRVPREDHWLTMALSELYQLEPNPDYATVAFLQARSMMDHQYTAADGNPRRIGASSRQSPINFTSTATKGEALAATWDLALALNDEAMVERIATAARRKAQFLMRVQFTRQSAARFPRPDRVVGGWGRDAGAHNIRIDFVQHNLSALLGVWHLTVNGRLPVATPLAQTAAPTPGR